MRRKLAGIFCFVTVFLSNEKTIGVGSLGLLLTFFSLKTLKNGVLRTILFTRGGGYSHTLRIRVCSAQRGRDFEARGLERGIHFRRGF